jgi:hypothetical protein
LIILALSGCVENQPKVIYKECKLPKLPTYRPPKSRQFSVVKLDENRSIIKTSTLLELVSNNKKLREINYKYARLVQKLNKIYGGKK